MAMLYFKEQACDIVVMETGIGGRYDSTNALGVPEVAVITKIGFDHMAVLGNTLEEIAGEKAGIMKPGCPVVMHDQQPSVLAVLQENFREINQGRGEVDTPQLYVAANEDYEYVRTIPMKMSTGYQIENAATIILSHKVLYKYIVDALGVVTHDR
jgi:dihydrofolate synthase/folylpolyglutamate synthase